MATGIFGRKGGLFSGAFVRNQKVDMVARFPPIGEEGVLRVLRDVFWV